MHAALSLAARGLGRVAPNPAVGCILVKNGTVVGRGWTQPGGRPHAETEALRRAGQAASGATAYVTLEPCSHFGKTGPCAVALIDAGIVRVVVATVDPDPRVSGRGLTMLREAGIEVVEDVLRDEARALNKGFFLTKTDQRPFVSLKLATSLDGRIATATGQSKWITGPEARQDAQMIRASHDAILVGIGTVLADNPALTRRLPGIQEQPIRIVLDSRGRLPPDAVFCNGGQDSLQIVAPDCTTPPPSGVDRLTIARDADGFLSIPLILERLADQGITRLMVEGGGTVATHFLKSDLVDRIYWYRAGLAIGGDGVAGLSGPGWSNLGDAPRFRFVSGRIVGPDRLDVLERTP
ncbi:bifunctional diaminohydroxyphosphoribosylaminopyrimidine deaminase/5-amino-6-(5-phosphoribosylamino)uracil reductase RibD [Rhodospirillaceae bacterium KN72]|uniref:Riboflavin biosynthesis protein RibD n=2 Tax=Pacificispira spongiicola TaxID=2729598 RepID=A0A7Y0E2H2_9PROT|nr:bifunctional diaminohydroxyphosphoribosylaminopyrimidine deaminase/5-amino-6-(5-phosphoribosylamino)uracil reductase RibD [Pacificispira spongiicola]